MLTKNFSSKENKNLNKIAIGLTREESGKHRRQNQASVIKEEGRGGGKTEIYCLLGWKLTCDQSNYISVECFTVHNFELADDNLMRF